MELSVASSRSLCTAKNPVYLDCLEFEYKNLNKHFFCVPLPFWEAKFFSVFLSRHLTT